MSEKFCESGHGNNLLNSVCWIPGCASSVFHLVAPSQTGTPRTADAWADVDQFSHDERQQRRRDLSRQLERELDEMTQEMLRIAALNAQHVGELSQAKRDAERLLRASQEIRLDFANHAPEEQAKWIHLPEFRAAIDAALAKREGEGN